jgi:two-component system sensor histidine kinase KdpD
VQLEDGRWLEVASYPADLGGGTPNTLKASRIVVLRDITPTRVAAEAREAFLGVLSHELRTPVTTIFGYAKVLQRPTPRPDQAEMLSDIEIESDRLYRIVEDLLALSRVEAGFTVEGEPVLVQHLVPPLMRSEARRWVGIDFEARIPLDLPAVFGEQTYVEQVLRNLLSNAGKYSPPGAAVTVEAEGVADSVIVRVLDRGVGIDPDEAGRLFELYYRAPGAASAVAGAGIGLYVARGLVTAMDGDIWAKPREDGGAEFGFSLPRYREDPEDSAVDPP